MAELRHELTLDKARSRGERTTFCQLNSPLFRKLAVAFVSTQKDTFCGCAPHPL